MSTSEPGPGRALATLASYGFASLLAGGGAALVAYGLYAALGYLSYPSDCNGDTCAQYPLEAVVATTFFASLGVVVVGPSIATMRLMVARGTGRLAELARERPWITMTVGIGAYLVVVGLWLGMALGGGPDWYSDA